MSNRFSFRTPFYSQRVYESQTLLKFEQQHFSSIASSSWDKLSWKMFLLVTFEGLGQLVNTFTSDDKYFLRRERIFPNQYKWNYLKIKSFFPTFGCFSKIYIKSWKFFEKEKPQKWLRKICLLKCPKGLVLGHPFAVNVFTGPRQWWNLHDNTFILLCYHTETDWFVKRLS